MRNIFKKTTQSNEQSDYVLRRPRYSGDPSLELHRLVKLGWDPTARTEADEPSRVQKIFQQKNTWGAGLRRNDKSRAFTLVETLVAISILMLSVTGPLYYASESLKAAIYARDQITAFYLAQDAFEQIRKVRDDNIYGTNSWNTGLTDCLTACRINTDETFYNFDNGSDYYLYRNDTEGSPKKGIYSHLNTGTKTIFKRTVQIVPTDGYTGPAVWTNTTTEMKVTVTIAWNSRGVDRSFTAYEFLRRLNN